MIPNTRTPFTAPIVRWLHKIRKCVTYTTSKDENHVSFFKKGRNYSSMTKRKMIRLTVKNTTPGHKILLCHYLAMFSFINSSKKSVGFHEMTFTHNVSTWFKQKGILSLNKEEKDLGVITSFSSFVYTSFYLLTRSVHQM